MILYNLLFRKPVSDNQSQVINSGAQFQRCYNKLCLQCVGKDVKFCQCQVTTVLVVQQLQRFRLYNNYNGFGCTTITTVSVVQQLQRFRLYNNYNGFGCTTITTVSVVQQLQRFWLYNNYNGFGCTTMTTVSVVQQ